MRNHTQQPIRSRSAAERACDGRLRRNSPLVITPYLEKASSSDCSVVSKLNPPINSFPSSDIVSDLHNIQERTAHTLKHGSALLFNAWERALHMYKYTHR